MEQTLESGKLRYDDQPHMLGLFHWIGNFVRIVKYK